MAALLSPETVEYLRSLPPERAFAAAREAAYSAGAISSFDFLEVFEELVDQGILTQQQIEEFEAMGQAHDRW